MAALEDDVFAVGKLDADAGAARVHGGEGDVLALHGDELPERLGIDLIAQADLVAEGQIVDIAVFNGVGGEELDVLPHLEHAGQHGQTGARIADGRAGDAMPQPDGPRKTQNSPFLTDRLRFSST